MRQHSKFSNIFRMEIAFWLVSRHDASRLFLKSMKIGCFVSVEESSEPFGKEETNSLLSFKMTNSGLLGCRQYGQRPDTRLS